MCASSAPGPRTEYVRVELKQRGKPDVVDPNVIMGSENFDHLLNNWCGDFPILGYGRTSC